MADGWGSRIGAAIGLFGLVTMVLVIPVTWLAATISCWGQEQARNCGVAGAFVGMVAVPVVGLLVAVVYVVRDARRQ
jgi:hypothetical protein